MVLEDPYLNDGLACCFNTIGVGHGMDVVGVGLVQVEYVSILPQHFQVDSISLQPPHPLLPRLRALRQVALLDAWSLMHDSLAI